MQYLFAVPRHRYCEILQNGMDLMNQEHTETRQQIITKLAMEEGITMIKALADLAVDCPTEEMTIHIFKERTLPFF